MKKLLLIIIAPIALTMTFLIGIVVAVTTTSQLISSAAACSVGFATAPITYSIDKVESIIDKVTGKPKGFTREQADNAALIIGIGKARSQTDDRIKVALMAALQESGLKNLAYGDRDSIGLFQMRPSQGWGTFEQIMDRKYAINRFFDVLDSKVPDLAIMSLGQAAQTVEVSARPNEYDKWQDDAEALIKAAIPTTGHALAFVGDSIGVGIENIGAGQKQFKAAGWDEVSFNSESGRRIVDQPASGSPASGITAVEQLLSAGIDPDYWVIELGTNDVSSLSSDAEATTLINALLDKLGPSRQVLWINTYLPGRAEKSKLFNTALETIAKQRSNLKISDWAAYAQDNPGMQSTDQVHYTPAGYGQMAYIIAQASVALRENPVVTTNPGSSFDPCKTGKKIIDKALDIILGQVGLPFHIPGIGGPGKSIKPGAGLLDWAFATSGLELPDPGSGILPAGSEVIDYTTAERGDLVYWAANPGDQTTITQRGIYLGQNQVIIEPSEGQTTLISPMNWINVKSVVHLDLPDTSSTTDNWQSPIKSDYTISSGFGMRLHPITGKVEMHDGIDMAAADGTKVYAPASGSVTKLSRSPIDGAMVYIDHGNGIQTFFFDMADFNSQLTVGQQVAAGQEIGTIGNCQCSGSTGSHVHLRVHVSSQPYDPMRFFSERGVRLDQNGSYKP